MLAVKERFQTRKHTLEQTCQSKDLPNPKCQIQTAGFSLKYTKSNDVMYCAIEKTGSTFWKRILHVIGGWGNTSNPSEIRSKDADSKKGGFKTLEGLDTTEIESYFKKSTTSIMFVRDPFTRAFSCWVDKFYSTNVAYWSSFGKTIKSYRSDSSKKNSQCGHDISIAEFIDFLVKTISKSACTDVHFSPNHEHCFQCNFQYDYIGKYETLREDTYFLLQTMNLSDTVTFTDFRKDAVYDATVGLVEWLFTQKEPIKKCGVSFQCSLFRSWRQFQGRGILDKHAEFPYSDESVVKALTPQQLINDLFFVHKRSDTNGLKNNRQEALAQAFQSVPKYLLQKFIDVFKLDFEMFDYETSPGYLNSKVDESFNFFEPCPYA